MADMGERIFRPGIRTSDRTAKLIRSGGWMAQVFYDWLITLVDDFGRYDARPSILRVEIFPLLLDKVRESDVERCLAECEKAGLIRLYAIKSKPYLELLDFRQRLRAMKSKFPAPTDAGKCHDNDVTMPSDTETDTDSETDTDTEPPKPPPAARAVGDEKDSGPLGFAEFWKLYPNPQDRKNGKRKCLAKWKSRKLEGISDQIIAGLKRWIVSEKWAENDGKYVPGPDRFLNEDRWESHPVPKNPNPSDDDGWTDLTEEELQRRLDSLPPEDERGAA